MRLSRGGVSVNDTAFPPPFALDRDRGGAGARVGEPAEVVDVPAAVGVRVGQEVAVEGARGAAVRGGEVDKRLLGLRDGVCRGGVQVAGAPTGVRVEQAEVVPDLVGDEVAVVGVSQSRALGSETYFTSSVGRGTIGGTVWPGVGRVPVAPPDSLRARAVAEEDHDLARYREAIWLPYAHQLAPELSSLFSFVSLRGSQSHVGSKTSFDVGVGEGLVGPGDALREVVEGERVLPLAVVVRQRDGVDA